MKIRIVAVYLLICVIACKSDSEKLENAINSQNYEKLKELTISDENLPLSESPLFLAYDLHDLKAMRILLENGAFTESMTNKKTLLEIAYEEERFEVVELLLQYGADSTFSIRRGSLYEPLAIFFILDGHDDYLQYALDDFDYAYKNNDGNTILHIAAENGLSSKHFLNILEHFDDVNILNKRQETPFLCGCRSSNTKNLNLLIDKGADPTLSSLYNYPWGVAIRNIYKYENYDVANFLLEYGPDLNDIRSHADSTPLAHACQILDLDLAKYLLDNGADPNVINKQGFRAINQLGGPHGFTEEQKSNFESLFSRYNLLALFEKDNYKTYTNQYMYGPARNIGRDFLNQLSQAKIHTENLSDIGNYIINDDDLSLNENDEKIYREYVGFYERKEAFTFDNLYNNFYGILPCEATWGKGFTYIGRKPFQVFYDSQRKDFIVDEIYSGILLSQYPDITDKYVKTCGPSITAPLFLDVIKTKDERNTESWDDFTHQYSQEEIDVVKAFFEAVLTNNFKDIDLLISSKDGYLFHDQIEKPTIPISLEIFRHDLYKHDTDLMDHLDTLQSSLSQIGVSHDFEILYNCFYGEDILSVEDVFGRKASLFEFIYPNRTKYLSIILVEEGNTYKVAYFNDSFFLP